jgi:tetratricopeptide (TPR) repeat protein
VFHSAGSVVAEQGATEASFVFFEEALRLDPAFAKARYNRGNARLVLGELEAALTDCETALGHAGDASDRAMMRLARSTILLCLGRIEEGWDEYEARLDPQFAAATHFLVDAPRWTPDSELAGRTLLLMGEQGLGDEVLFASLVPDALEAVGPRGKVLLAVESRLVSLMQRSFPAVEVVAHATYNVSGRTVRGAAAFEDRADIDLWTPMASLLRRFRRRIEDFPAKSGFLEPDPARVRHWRAELAKAPAGRKVGLLWKSMKLDAGRARYYAPFHLWAPVLTTPGTTFVNIQYGDCAPETEWAQRTLGVSLWTPPAIDLRDDLDDIAALASALDLTVGFANATSNIAAAVGAPTWMISAPGAWTRVGAEKMPWYPQARVFTVPGFGRWEETMGQVAKALAEMATG